MGAQVSKCVSSGEKEIPNCQDQRGLLRLFFHRPSGHGGITRVPQPDLQLVVTKSQIHIFAARNSLISLNILN
jgi:hypothetical protein